MASFEHSEAGGQIGMGVFGGAGTGTAPGKGAAW